MYHDMSQALTPRHQGDSFCGSTSTGNGGPFANFANFNWFHDFSTNFMNFLPTPDGNVPAFDPNFLNTPVPAKPGKMSFDYGTRLTTPHSRYRKDDPNVLPEERERRDRRRQRNKEAAARCRQRRLDLIDELVGRVDTIKQENEEKERQMENMRKEMGAVVEYFKTHLDHMSGMEKEAVERAVSLLDRLPTQGSVSYVPHGDTVAQKSFSMTQTAETECKFTDLLPPKHGHFNGITGFSALPPLHDNIMGDYMFMNFNQITGMTTANGPNSTADPSLEQ